MHVSGGAHQPDARGPVKRVGHHDTKRDANHGAQPDANHGAQRDSNHCSQPDANHGAQPDANRDPAGDITSSDVRGAAACSAIGPPYGRR